MSPAELAAEPIGGPDEMAPRCLGFEPAEAIPDGVPAAEFCDLYESGDSAPCPPGVCYMRPDGEIAEALARLNPRIVAHFAGFSHCPELVESLEAEGRRRAENRIANESMRGDIARMRKSFSELSRALADAFAKLNADIERGILQGAGIERPLGLIKTKPPPRRRWRKRVDKPTARGARRLRSRR